MSFFSFGTRLLCLLSLTQLWHGAAAAEVLKQSCINEACSAKRVTISNPPVNLWDANVIEQFNALLQSLNNQNETKVVVFNSDDADFWAAHLDLNLFQPDPIPGRNSSALLVTYYENLELLLTTPVIFIGEVNGRAWGSGDEHLLRMDMRFAGPDAQFGAPEAAAGLIHVGGLQQLVRLIGPGRASEYMLAAAQVSGHEAARIGWVNSVHPSAEALRKHVDNLAARIALFPVEGLRATKASIAELAPPKAVLDRDRARFEQLGALPQVQQNVADVLRLSKNQSKEWELNNNDNIVRYLY
jgi:enoyl-CoA hydratase/carnithine racemase